MRSKRGLLIAVLSLVLALPLVEAILYATQSFLPRDLRVMWIRRAVLPRAILGDRELGYALRPAYARDLSNGPGRLAVRHEAYPACPELGYRGSAEDARADIAVVGDSIVYGAEVDQQATMTAQLERLSGRRTLNLAVTGYGTTQELLLYRRCGGELSPRLVLVLPFVNDPLDNLHFEEWRRSGAAQGLPFAKWCRIFGIPWPSMTCTALTAVNARFTLGDIVVHRLARRIKLDSLNDEGAAARGVTTMCRDLGELQDLARVRGARLAAVFPEHWTLMGSPQRAALARLRACARSRGVPFLDLGSEPAPPPLGRLDWHWTEAGHRDAAEKIWRFISKEKLLRLTRPSP